MAEKVLAKDAEINSVYLTRGGKQVDAKGKESLWGFHPVRVLRKEFQKDEIIKVAVLTPWDTELPLDPNYPLEVTDLQTLPAESTSILTDRKVSFDDEAPPEYIEKLKTTKKEEQVREDPHKDNKSIVVEELKKGTPLKQIVEKVEGMDYHAVYSYVSQLKKNGVYKIQKVGKGIFKIVEG